MAQLRMSNLKKTYGKVEVIKGVDLDIEHGEFVVFVGPSGCGKSTLLRMIAGLEDITDGDLYIGDERVNDMQPRDRKIAMVFQSYALYPHMNVYDNVGFGLRLAKTPKAEMDAKVHEAARILQMEHLLDRKPGQLSGGQRQRVAIGRAIVREPQVFLFDEPLSNLDAALRLDMRVEIAKLHGQLGATMVYVTHDQVEAMTLADKIVVLNQGVAQQIGSPLDLYHHPANLFVAGFIGSPKMNFFEAKVVAEDGKPVARSDELRGVDLSKFSVASGDKVTVGIRPQHLELSQSGDPALTGTVSLVERLGSETVLNVDLPSGRSIVAALNDDVDIKLGAELGFDLPLHRVHVFDAQGEAVTASA